MKKIILHDQQYSIGGPKAVLNGIVNSYLGEKFNFVRLFQTEACGFNPIKAIRFILKYRRLINQENADVIYICGLQYIGLLMTIASKFSNVKRIVLSVHGSEWDSPNTSLRKWILMHIVEPLEISLSDSVFTVCEAAQKTIKPLCGRKNNRGVVYNAFPTIDYKSVQSGVIRNELHISKEKVVVTSVGRVVESKGHSSIIDAIKIMNDDSFVFIIVGDGPFLDVYRDKCAAEIENGRLFLLGQRSDINEVLKDSDIFIFATFHENHSIALLEAVNMHCAAIVTNVGGNPEIIKNGYSGILVPPRDPEAIVEGLRKLKDPSLRKKYADRAYEFCSEVYSPSKTYGALDAVFSL